ncbi:MAG: peptidoglycan-binding outer rane lipoprotein Pal, OmpA family [Bacteriovoracaceae bacterium]|nr:peptidoglycan-binding outer rane lipoprotein Pal, OmpA family [Bacteriovoracaceae bacterium]
MSKLKKLTQKINFISVVLLSVVALAGCSAKSKSREAGGSGSSDSNYNDMKHGGVGLGLLERIHFDFDKQDIGPAAAEILKKNASTIKGSGSMRVLVEGHCDDRGTNEYNVALGERRAKAALNYLVSLGVARNRLEMKSWGKEKPLDSGHDDKAFADNRRAEFVILEK